MTVEVAVEGRSLSLSNLDKVLYPLDRFTKADVIDYYVRVSPVLLPHLRGRPITTRVFPEGVRGLSFFEKNCPAWRPDWVRTEPVWSESGRRTISFCLIDDLPTLVWAANLAKLELHPSLSVVPRLDRPTVVVFDLDPGLPAGLVECARVALLVRLTLDGLGLASFPKTTGSKGLQVYVPLHTEVDYGRTKSFARAIAVGLEATEPRLVVSRMAKSLRAGKVFVDWSQNDAHKTTVAVYSLRARERPTASTPVTWEEVERCARRRDPRALEFTAAETLSRVERHGDLFAPVLSLRQRLPR